MSHERYEELVIAHAVDGSLDAAGARDLIPHLASCDACRALLRDLDATASDLALSAPAVMPPADLEQRIVDGVRRAAAPRSIGRGRVRRMLVAAAAAVTLALGSTTVVLYRSLDQERRDARTVAAALDVIGDPDARIARLAAAEGSARAVLALGDGRGVLVVDDLDRTPAGRVHELWLIEDGTPRPIEVFTVRDARTIVRFDAQGLDVADAAAITLEAGPLGSPEPTGAMLLSGPVV